MLHVLTLIVRYQWKCQIFQSFFFLIKSTVLRVSGINLGQVVLEQGANTCIGPEKPDRLRVSRAVFGHHSLNRGRTPRALCGLAVSSNLNHTGSQEWEQEIPFQSSRSKFLGKQGLQGSLAPVDAPVSNFDGYIGLIQGKKRQGFVHVFCQMVDCMSIQ